MYPGKTQAFFDKTGIVVLCRKTLSCMAASSCCRHAKLQGVGSSLPFEQKEAAAQSRHKIK